MQKALFDSTCRNVYVHEEEGKKVFCYRTGMTVYEEYFENSRYVSAGWNASGYTLNVLEHFPARIDPGLFREPQAFDLEADGFSLAWDWDYVGFAQNEETAEGGAEQTHAVVTLKSRVRPLTVEVHTRLDGTPVFSRWLKVKNTGDAPMAIHAAAPFSGGVEVLDGWKDYQQGAPDNEKIYSLGYMDYASWGHEGYFRWHALPNAEFSIAGKYRRDRHRQPFFALRNELLGSTMIAELGWSGGWRFSFDLDADGASSKLALRLELESQKPLILLDPGESFETPAVHIGMLQGELDDAVYAMHTHLRRSVFTLPPARGVLGWIEGGMGPEHSMSVEDSRHFIDTIAAVGGETFIVDAGWFCPPGAECEEWHSRSGDWRPNAERYPNGIAEIRDYAHSKGLLFGMWFDLERIGDRSEAAKEHPEWISRCYVHGYPNSQLNMADPQAAAWAEAELSRAITEYGIEVFRLDYNLDTTQLLNRIDRKNGPENAYIRYYQNVYAMYERLRRKFPDVIFENCAGGGGRTDVGFVANFTHTWISDWNVAPRSLAIVNGMTMALPPEWCDRLVSGMNCHTRASLDFQVRCTLFGRPSTNDYNAVGSVSNPDQLAFIRHTFDLYKTCIRPYIRDGRIFHHTPELVCGHDGAGGTVEQPQGTAVLERAAADGSCSVVGVFRLADAGGEEVTTVYPRGLNAAFAYTVTRDNSGETYTAGGAALENEGVRVRLCGSMTSELLIFCKAEQTPRKLS